MYEKQIKVTNPTGIHARPASQLVTKANNFKSAITMQRVGDDSKYNVKSIVMLLAMGLAQGEEAVLSANGEDEVAAVEELTAFIESLTE